MAKRLINFVRDRDWRIWLGVIVTMLWLAGSVWYLQHSGARAAQDLPLDAVGSFLEGVFAPLAFLWLVLGLFIQQRELANNTAVLRESTAHTEKQTLAIAATEMNARQESFFKIADSVKHQLGGISGMLLTSGLGPPGSGRFSREEMDEQFARSAKGDFEVFARLFIGHAYLEEGGIADLLYGTDIRTRHTRSFIATFERLLHLARNCDVDRIIEDSLLQSAFGLLYAQMLALDPSRDRASAP